MTTAIRNISHNSGISREVAEVYSRYADTVNRLRTIGTDEDAISEDFYQAALKIYADTLILPGIIAELSDQERRDTLASLATIALRWSRKVRIGTPPVTLNSAVREGGKPDES